DHAEMNVPFTPGDAPGEVIVEKGALLQSAANGKLMLFGPKVHNAGQLEARDGQIILAAGEQVWLSTDASQQLLAPNVVRGLDVAVSGPYPWLVNHEEMSNPAYTSALLAEMAARADAVGYGVTNTGSIHVDRGNITLQSREITQNGVIT